MTTWIYNHMMRSPYEKAPRAYPSEHDTREAAEARRSLCTEGRGCCGSCIRAGGIGGTIVPKES